MVIPIGLDAASPEESIPILVYRAINAHTLIADLPEDRRPSDATNVTEDMPRP